MQDLPRDQTKRIHDQLRTPFGDRLTRRASRRRRRQPDRLATCRREPLPAAGGDLDHPDPAGNRRRRGDQRVNEDIRLGRAVADQHRVAGPQHPGESLARFGDRPLPHHRVNPGNAATSAMTAIIATQNGNAPQNTSPTGTRAAALAMNAFRPKGGWISASSMLTMNMMAN